MIASVVATLDQDPAQRTQFLANVTNRAELEVGETNSDSSRIPMTIDVNNRHQMEDSTEWLRTQPGVLMVDVVFVHFEEETR